MLNESKTLIRQIRNYIDKRGNFIKWRSALAISYITEQI